MRDTSSVSVGTASIPLFRPFIAAEALAAVATVLESGWLGEGPKVKDFERELSDFLGGLAPEQVVTVNSGTSALTLALHLIGVGPGDEVISTPMTCSATNEPIVLSGARIVWADVDPCSGNIDPSSVRSQLTPRTKAIMAVHWGGVPCDLGALMGIAVEGGCVLIEDAAHALGATYRDRPIGHHGDYVCFSFQAVKQITTGDGGLLVCRDVETARRARRLRWFGIDRDRRTDFAMYAIDECGFKFHMNDIAAAIGLASLPHLKGLLAHRAAIAARYDAGLADCDGVELTFREPDNRSAYWLYTILVDRRQDFRSAMAAAGIETSLVHYRNDRYGAFASALRPGNLDGLDSFSERMVCIPIGHWVTTEDAEAIIATIRKGW